MANQTQIQWGLDKTTTPYGFGANINGAWSNLGTVTSGGVWAIPASNISGTISGLVLPAPTPSVLGGIFSAAAGVNQFMTGVNTSGAPTFAQPTASNVSFTQAGVGAVAQTVNTKLQQTVNVKDFGAVGNGVADDTAAIQAAIATGNNVYLPKGTFKVTDMLTLGAGQALIGANMADTDYSTTIKIDLDFNLTALGVVRFGSVVGSQIYNINFDFYQDTTQSTRAAVIQYPPAIYANGSTHFIVDQIRVTRGWRGIEMTGNVGGAWIDRAELGALDKNIIIDGSFDFIHMGSIHVWCYGLPGTAMLNVWLDGQTNALDVGRVDGLNIAQFATYVAKITLAGVGGVTQIIPVIFGSLQLDNNHAELIISDKNVVVNSLYSTKSVKTVPTIQISSGSLNVGTAHVVEAGVSPFIEVTGGIATINGGVIDSRTNNAIACSVSAGTLALKNTLLTLPATARTVGYVQQSGTGTLNVSNCSQVNGNARMIVEVTADVSGNFISNNSFNTGIISVPTGAYLGCYGPNRAASYTFNPVVEFATLGDFVPTYVTRVGRMWYETNAARFELRVVFTCNAYTTASGNLLIKGIPLTEFGGEDVTLDASVCMWSKITLSAGYTEIGATKSLASDCILLRQMGSGLTYGTITATNIPASTTNVEIVISGTITQFPKF